MDVIKAIIQKPKLNLKKLESALASFVDKEIKGGQGEQSVNPLVTFLSHHPPKKGAESRILFHKVLLCMKILLRNEKNRQILLSPHSSVAFDRIVFFLSDPLGSREIAKEVCNVLLNLCHSSGSVPVIVERGVIFQLVKLFTKISIQDAEVLFAVLGACQSVCTEKDGRMEFMCHVVSERGEVMTRINDILLFCDDNKENVAAQCHYIDKVKERAVSLLHNLSADGSNIAIIRDAKVIPVLIPFLRSCRPNLVNGAASTLQNMSREVKSREIMHALNVTILMLDLVGGNDMKIQIIAAATLLNLVGERLSNHHLKTKNIFHETLTELITLGALCDCFE